MKVPDRWTNCPRRGELIAGKFIPSKTPLDSKYDNSVDEENRYTVEMIVKDKQKNIGMVIDLTKSTAYYNDFNVLDWSCKYKKIECAGFEEAPTRQQVKLFNDECQTFFRTNPGEKILVHCTHGFNRTGFMIISYLVEIEDWSLSAAYAAFKIARPPGIYKKHYVEELNNRYASSGEDQEDEKIPVDDVIMPNWEIANPDEDDPNALDNNVNGDEKTATGCPHANKQILGVKSLEASKGDVIRKVRSFVCESLEVKSGNIFPGSQPVSMDMRNTQFLAEQPYKVSWKADGMRLLLVILDEHQIYLCDRDFTVFPVGDKISFWSREDNTQHLKMTLLDGEMVTDVFTEIVDGVKQKQEIPRYLAYDLITLNGKSIKQYFFDHRLNVLTHEVVQPRQKLIAENKIDRSSELFGVRVKSFYDITFTERLLSQKFKESIAHETDGLIFQPVQQKYTPLTFPMLLKWKPPELNSLDFMLKIVIEGGPGKIPRKMAVLLVSANHQYVPFSEMKFTKDLEQYNNRIIECSWDFKNSTWHFMKVRTDKSHPNHLTVANNVIESIRNPVQDHYLIDFIEKHGYRKKSNSSNNDLAASPVKKPHIHSFNS